MMNFQKIIATDNYIVDYIVYFFILNMNMSNLMTF